MTCKGKGARKFAPVTIRILVILDDGGDGLEHVIVALLHRALQVEVLDREMVVPVFEAAPHRLEIGFLQCSFNLFLVAEIALQGVDS